MNPKIYMTRKLFSIIFLLCFLANPLFAAVTDYEQDIIPEAGEGEQLDAVLVNKEIRKTHQKSDDNATSITTNTTNVSANTTNIAINTTNITNQGIDGWVNFDGTTNTAGFCTIQDSYNVVSVADNGTGDYTITWDTDFANANYVCVGSAGYFNTTEAVIVNFDNYAVGSVDLETNNNDGVNRDVTDVCVFAIGDQ